MYNELRQERIAQQEAGKLPEWVTTGGYQLLRDKYLSKNETYYDRIHSICRTAVKHLPQSEKGLYYGKFLNMIWHGWVSLSTPILANMGTDKGMPISCSGGVISDSVQGFYDNLAENAILTKHGFGTSAYLGDIRPRGSSISVGGKASGVLPVLKDLVTMSMNVSQGSVRRGAIASYLPVEHGDFWEVINYLEREPDGLNIGWCVSDNFNNKLTHGDTEALCRFQRILKTKMVTGKGYIFFPDKVNRHRPEAYVRNNLYVKTSNLCNEITLFADENHSFTCVLSSLNLAKYEEWRDTEVVSDLVVFLNCVISEFLEHARGVKHLENAVRFTEKGRAIGIGVCGFSTMLQKKMIPFMSLAAISLNKMIFKQIRMEAEEATEAISEVFPSEWCTGLNRANSHLLAIAPTKSTALIMGGVSEGINPDPAMVFTQATAGGEVQRVNPALLELMKFKDVYNEKNIAQITEARGSVQGVDFLDDYEKDVFKTAFEIDQHWVIRLAEGRSPHIDQWQSLNLFFSAEEDPKYIASVHKKAFDSEAIRGLYYIYSKAGLSGSSSECSVCQ